MQSSTNVSTQSICHTSYEDVTNLPFPSPWVVLRGGFLTNYVASKGHKLVSDSANPHYVSDPLPRPLWDHRSTGQL